MSKYKSEFMRYLDQKGVKYQELDDRRVLVRYGGENLKTIAVTVSFDKNESNTVQLYSFEIASFKEDKFAAGLLACNALNARFRWVKFYLDSDRDVIAEMDAVVDYNSVGEECFELVIRMVGIIDEAYPEFMKAMWQ